MDNIGVNHPDVRLRSYLAILTLEPEYTDSKRVALDITTRQVGSIARGTSLVITAPVLITALRAATSPSVPL